MGAIRRAPSSPAKSIQAGEDFLPARFRQTAGNAGTAEWFPSFSLQNVTENLYNLSDGAFSVYHLFQRITQQMRQCTGLL